MLNINDRIKRLRQEICLNQQQFADKLGLTQGQVSRLEKNGNTVTEQNIKAICTTFKVSEEWLRNGHGEMFLSNKGALIDRMKEEMNLNDTELAILNVYVSLPIEGRNSIMNFAKKISTVISNTKKISSTDSNFPQSQTYHTPISKLNIFTEEELAAYEKVRAFKENIQHHNGAVISENMKHLDDLDPKLLEEIEKSSAIYKEHLIQEARATNSSASSFTEGKSEK